MKKFIIILAVFFTSCISTTKVLSSLEHSDDRTYGYSFDNPILIGHYNSWQKNTDLAYTYLSRLKYNDNSLKMILHVTVKKPSDQPRKNKPIIPRRWGTPTNLGAEFLDLWVMHPRGTKDTIRLYFDVEIEGKIKVPHDLEFDINQTNNIFK